MTGFELITSTTATPMVTDLMGLWRPTVAVAGADRELVFGTEHATPGVVPPTLWRVSLGELSDATNVTLVQANARLLAAQDHLERVESATVRGALRIAAILRDIQREMANVRAHVDACLAFLATARDAFRRDAAIETLMAGRRVGWSRVPLLGSVDTIVSAPLDRRHTDLHLQVVDLSLRSRAAMMRMLVILVRCAGILMVAVSSPLGPVLGVAAAWRLVNSARWGPG